MQIDIERLLNAIQWQESCGNQNAVSPKGARTAFDFA
jgi:membrane-bound lytic murein transglycosylase MltF